MTPIQEATGALMLALPQLVQAPATPLCACREDGYCERYRRGMHGRSRQICQGIDVDPGEAAQYRQHWLAQANGTTAITDGAPERTAATLTFTSVAFSPDPHSIKPLR